MSCPFLMMCVLRCTDRVRGRISSSYRFGHVNTGYNLFPIQFYVVLLQKLGDAGLPGANHYIGFAAGFTIVHYAGKVCHSRLGNT